MYDFCMCCGLGCQCLPSACLKQRAAHCLRHQQGDAGRRNSQTTYSEASLTGREHAVEGFFDKVLNYVPRLYDQCKSNLIPSFMFQKSVPSIQEREARRLLKMKWDLILKMRSLTSIGRSKKQNLCVCGVISHHQTAVLNSIKNKIYHIVEVPC
jgi:hypothetical protein